MAKRRHIYIFFKFSSSVPVFLGDASAFKAALTKAPGNTYVTIPPAAITEFEAHLATLSADQAKAERRGEGLAAARDLSLNVVVRDVDSLVRIVQRAADKAPDEGTAIAIAHSCGLHVKGKGVHAKSDFKVTRDKKTAGLLHLVSISAGKNIEAAYEWQSSRNGINFTTFDITTESYTTWESDVPLGTKMHFRRRIIVSKRRGGKQSWSQVVSIIVS